MLVEESCVVLFWGLVFEASQGVERRPSPVWGRPFLVQCAVARLGSSVSCAMPRVRLRRCKLNW
ncbi:hypothetical protein QJS10_CPB04g01925 [Acorus calamus]|uniref:Secreted protein n=1 Tax=Acorus calamus TaxID=4465 RepID=A0AAV9F5N7_ACOCL|nr:hypothetical protein QJS10_CPB04g01925 [Acorus calamus]